MYIVEELIEEMKVQMNSSKTEQSRYRLKAVDGEETVKRKVGVQHIPSAKIAKTMFTRLCSSCYCLSHCKKNPQNDNNDVELKLSDLDVNNDDEL